MNLLLLRQTISTIAIMVALQAVSPAATINVDINAPLAGGAGTYSGPGASPDTGTSWNGEAVAPFGGSVGTFTSGALQESDGMTTATGVTFSVTGGTGFDDAYFSGPIFANALLQDFVYPGPGSITLTINGLVAGNSYDLYLYSEEGGNNNESIKFTVTGVATPQTVSNVASDLTGFVVDGNYAPFLSVVATGGVITVVASNATNNGAINGFQISGNFVAPEPSSIMLLALGTCGLMILARRKRPSIGPTA